jgi:DNA-binding HxlR family transcriptional regulator
VRSYEQYCPLALGLDIVGDRWTLLIVRELGIRPSRYQDIHDALPGIATNLLADRLRTLTAEGVVEVRTTPRPTVARVYVLTEWGHELYEIVLRLGRWGSRTLLAGSDGRRFLARYTIPVIQAIYGIDADRSGLAPLTLRIDGGGERVHVTLSPEGVDAEIDEADRPADVTLDGGPEAILGLLAGVVDPRTAAGFHADRSATRRFRAWTRRARPTSSRVGVSRQASSGGTWHTASTLLPSGSRTKAPK